MAGTTEGEKQFRRDMVDHIDVLADIMHFGVKEQRLDPPSTAEYHDKFIIAENEFQTDNYLQLSGGNINIESATPWSDWTGDSVFTIDMYIRTENTDLQYIFYCGREADATADGFNIQIRADGQLRAYMTDGTNVHEARWTNDDFRDGNWHRLTMVRDGENNGQSTAFGCWVDGVRETQSPETYPQDVIGDIKPPDGIYFSDPRTGASYTFSGDMADIRIADGIPWWIDGTSYDDTMVAKRATSSELYLRDGCYLHLNEESGNPIDRTPRKLTATLTGTTSWESETEFLNKQSNYVFSYAEGEYSYAPATAGDETDLTASLTLEAVLYLQSLPTDARVFERASDGGVQYGIVIEDDRWGVTLDDVTQWDSRTIPTGEIIHVAMTWDGTTVKGYWNGVERISESVSGPLTITGDRLATCVDYNNDDGLRGWIDEIRLWNDARTQSELDDYRRRIIDETATGLVGYWRMDERAGVIAVDHSGSEINGPNHLRHVTADTTQESGGLYDMEYRTIDGGLIEYGYLEITVDEPTDLTGGEWLGTNNYYSASNLAETTTGELKISL